MSELTIPAAIRRTVRQLDKDKKLNLDLIKQISQILHDDGNVYLHGPVRAGKSVLAATVLLKAVEGDWVLPNFNLTFISSHQLIEDLTPDPSSNFSTKAYLKKLQNDVHWLVVDDIGCERLSDFAYQRLFLLIDWRLNWLKPTIFTSNFDIPALCDRFPGDRLLWRLEQHCQIVCMDRRHHEDRREKCRQ